MNTTTTSKDMEFENIIWYTVPSSMRPRPEHAQLGSGMYMIKDKKDWRIAVVSLDAMGRFDLRSQNHITVPTLYARI